MINSIKTRTPILALILLMFAVGYTFASNKVVVIPLGGDSQPAGMVSAFNSETCPTGWMNYTGATGRIVVGLNDGGTLGGTEGVAYTDREKRQHQHLWSRFFNTGKSWNTFNSSGSVIEMVNWSDGIGNEGSGYYPIASVGASTQLFYTGKADSYPPYVQLLYCEKV